MSQAPLVAVTGATGYVGGRLVPRLLEAGYRVRVVVRDASRLGRRPWLDQVEVAEADVLRPETLEPALQGAMAAYYLIHSMRGGEAFHERDHQAALDFGQAAKRAGVERIVYLGGLGDPDSDLSQHLRSRQVTGAMLAQAGVPVTEFRAAIVVGAGSLSFELIRALTERLPAMICPRWVYTRVQPIAIDDVLAYLVAALETPASAGQVIEIGGQDVTTYGGMMLGYATARGLRRFLIPVPVLTPRLSSYWVHLVTPIPSDIAQPLIEGLRNEVIVRDNSAQRLFPSIRPMSYPAALQAALANLKHGEVDTSWMDSLASSQGDLPPVILANRDGMILERRQRHVAAPPPFVFAAFTSLGGARRWPALDWAWRLRGAMDRLAGGVGMRRGRRHPQELRVGDALDFWRVEAVEPDRMLRLRAEMKVPGGAWLQFEVEPEGQGSALVQTALFAPRGLFGLIYWYALYPFHSLIFSRMIDSLRLRAETLASRRPGLQPQAG
jgi:uncharacterized protein YbjT (DUF2867 family)